MSLLLNLRKTDLTIMRDGVGLVPALVTLLLLLAAGSAVAQSSGPRLVDRIVAIVDEEAILQSDLDREVELYRMEKEYSGETITADPETVRREMLERRALEEQDRDERRVVCPILVGNGETCLAEEAGPLVQHTYQIIACGQVLEAERAGLIAHHSVEEPDAIERRFLQGVGAALESA